MAEHASNAPLLLLLICKSKSKTMQKAEVTLNFEGESNIPALLGQPLKFKLFGGDTNLLNVYQKIDARKDWGGKFSI